MTDPLPEDQRLKDISPKAYEHPADRAATAALQSIPMMDMVVRKLIEFGYERALRQVLLAGSVKLGPDQLPGGVGVAPRGAARGWTSPDVPDLYLTQLPITNAAAIGVQEADGDGQLAHRRAVRRARSCGRCSATRPATSCPTTCSTGPR